MAFTEIPDLDASETVSLGGANKKTGKKNPTSIEGYYIGTRQVPSQKAKSGFAALHILQTERGNVGVWGKTNLDQKMAGVVPGSMIRITFVGMVETRNNPMYKYKVEVDTSNSIDVSSVSSELPAEGDEDSSGADDTPETDIYAEEEAVDEVPVRRQATLNKTPLSTPSAAKQANVRALLNGGRK